VERRTLEGGLNEAGVRGTQAVELLCSGSYTYVNARGLTRCGVREIE